MFLLMLLASSALAAEPIDLEAATAMALERGVDLERAALSVAEREATLRTASLAWLPDLSARASTQASLGRTFSEQLGANVTEPVGSLSGSLTTSMPLYQGGAIRARKDEAEAWLAAARADLEQVEHDVRWAVADGMLALGEARAAVAIQEAAAASALVLERQVAAQVEAGTRTTADLHAQRAEVAGSRSALAAAEQTAREAELGLVYLLRLDPRERWTFEVPDEAPVVEGEASALIARGLDDRPALDAGADAIAASEAALRVARASRLPTLSLGAGVSSSYITSHPDPFADQFLDQYRTWAAIDLSVPIFDRGLARAEIDRARLALQRAELERRQLAEEIAVEVERLVTAIATAETSLTAARARVAAAEQALEVLTLRYEAGAADLVEVTNARASLIEAEMEQARSRSGVLRGNWLLAWTIGAVGPAR